MGLPPELAFGVWRLACAPPNAERRTPNAERLHKVEDREQDHPDGVDEVPVQGDAVHGNVMVSGPAATQAEHEDGDKRLPPQATVSTMQAGTGKDLGADDVRVVGRVQLLVIIGL